MWLTATPLRIISPSSQYFLAAPERCQRDGNPKRGRPSLCWRGGCKRGRAVARWAVQLERRGVFDSRKSSSRNCRHHAPRTNSYDAIDPRHAHCKQRGASAKLQPPCGFPVHIFHQSRGGAIYDSSRRVYNFCPPRPHTSTVFQEAFAIRGYL